MSKVLYLRCLFRPAVVRKFLLKTKVKRADPERPAHPHTLESKETKNSPPECKENEEMLKNPDVKNVNKSKNRLTPSKLESKKRH